MKYETFEHEADMGIRGYGATLEEAFAHAAAAMYSVIVDIGTVEAKEPRRITVSADDREQLLVEWLNALLALSDIERMVFSKFEVGIEGNSLAGTAWGERLDLERHHAAVEVKAATYHMLSVREDNGRFTAQCVVDV